MVLRLGHNSLERCHALVEYNIMPPQKSRKENIYQSYLLRLWRADERSSWQVVLVHVLSGEEIRFNSTDSLFLYLHKQTKDMKE